VEARGGARLRNAVGAVGLCAISLLVVLAAAEGLARVFWSAHEGRARESAADPALADLPALRTIRDLSRPNVRGRHGDILYRTNSAGFRGPEFDERPDPGTFRIVLVGDSYTMGWKIAEEEIYASRLQASLNRSGAASTFEVLNLGIGGLNIERVVNRLIHLGLRFQPHLIVYGITLNDIDGPEDRSEEDSARRSAVVDDWLRFADSRSILLRMLWPRWMDLRSALLPPEESYGRRLVATYGNPRRWRRISDGLDRLAAIQRRTGACVHVLIHTDLAHLRFFHPFTEIYQRIETAAEERGLTATQSFPAFRWRDSAALRVGAFDGHPNAEGHRILAESLLEGLRGLPEACGFPLSEG